MSLVFNATSTQIQSSFVGTCLVYEKPKHTAFPYPSFIGPEKSGQIETFTAAIGGEMLKEVGKTFDPKTLISLDRVLSLMTKIENPKIKAALYKERGIFVRFFSNESWEEWAESRTALGKVASLFADFAESPFRVQIYMKRLDVYTVQKAAAESEYVLNQLQSLRQTEAARQSRSNIDCPVGLILGTAGSVATLSPLPLGLAGLNCLKTVEARRWNSYQGHIILKPGEKFYIEGNRKLALCKRGATPWGSTCAYHGPDMTITVIHNHRHILFSGPYGGADHWHCIPEGGASICHLSLAVENTGNSESAMYVHMENEDN